MLVTGGSGLVGSAIREVIEETKPEDEEWIFRLFQGATMTEARGEDGARVWRCDRPEKAFRRRSASDTARTRVEEGWSERERH